MVDQQGKLLGILSLNDVACASAQKSLVGSTQSARNSSASTARTLAAVCAHRPNGLKAAASL